MAKLGERTSKKPSSFPDSVSLFGVNSRLIEEYLSLWAGFADRKSKEAPWVFGYFSFL
jgi:hypothetical protein